MALVAAGCAVPLLASGSSCLLRDGFLFTGDHLAHSASMGRLYAFRSACWYDWDEQIRSMETLVDVPFRWVLPGHGRRAELPDESERRAQMRACVDWMRQVR